MPTLPTGIHSPESFGNNPEDYKALLARRIETAQLEYNTSTQEAQRQSIQRTIDELKIQYQDEFNEEYINKDTSIN